MDDIVLSEIIKLAMVSEARERPTTQDWGRLESECTVGFPEDFKKLVSSLGSGWFGCGLSLKNPVSSSPYTVLSKASLLAMRGVLIGNCNEVGVKLYPEPDGLVSIGSVDRQIFFLRRRQSEEMLGDLVWWDLDMMVVRELGMSTSQFIYSLYRGTIREDWGQELSQYLWRGGRAPFFTQIDSRGNGGRMERETV